MQKLFHFVVGDFVLRCECEHYLVSLLALAILNCNAGSAEELASAVENAGLHDDRCRCARRRSRRLGSFDRLRFWGYRLIWWYLSRWGCRLSRFGGWGEFCGSRSRLRSAWGCFRRGCFNNWARRFRDRLLCVWCCGCFWGHSLILPHSRALLGANGSTGLG
mgnify:CR=1 FL=1